MENYKYDIFISYKHEALDKAVAAKLQKSLEHYKIPKEIQKKTGKEKIKRVFRDEEELAVSSDLGKEIEDQIEQSEYLLVVCSKKTKESQWVLKEIDTFLKYRDAEHILPVLIEGEPEESFPESILVYGEPMAADVRGKNEKEVLKKVKKELPRLIAPILHCSYDELKQRARNYQIKRMLIGTSVALVAVASFAAYAVFQSARLNKEYQETRRNQARNMAQISEKLLEQGDRIGALKTALAVLPENENSKEALVPEQMGALNDALYSYEVGNELDFQPMRAEYTEDKLIGKIQWNPQKEYYVTLDNAGYVYFFDGKTGKCIWKEFGDGLKEKVQGFYAVTFIDNDTAALLAEEKICIVNFKEKTLEKTIELNLKVENLSNGYGNKLDEYAILYNKTEILIYGIESIAVYDLKTEKLTFVIKKNDLKKSDSSIINKVIYANKDMILIGICDSLESGGGLFSYSKKNKKIRKISDENIGEIYVINNKYIGVSQYEIGEYKVKYSMDIYDYYNGKRIWGSEDLIVASDPYEYMGWLATEMKINQKLERVVLFYFKDTIYCFSLNSFKIINEKQYDTYIVGIEKYDDIRVLIGTADGGIFLYCDAFVEEKMSALVGNQYIFYGKIEPEVGHSITQFSYSKKSLNTVVQANMKAKMIVTGGNLKDTKVSKNFTKSKKEKENIRSVNYFSINEQGKEKTYRCVLYQKKNNNYSLDIYEVGKTKMVYRMEYPEDDILNPYIIGRRENDTVLCYITHEKYNSNIVHIINIKEKQEIEKYEIGDNLNADYVYNKDLSYIWYDDIEGLKCMRLSKKSGEKTDTELEKKMQSKDDVEKIWVSNNNQYVAVLYSNERPDYSKNYYLKVWDIKNETWKKINGQEKIEGFFAEEDLYSYTIPQVVTFGRKNNWLAVSKGDTTIEIIDLDKGRTQHILSISGPQNKEKKWICTIEFFDDEQYMIVRECENQIALWDIQKEKRIMNQKIDETFYNGDEKIKAGNQYFAVEEPHGRVTIFTVDDKQRFSLYADVSGGWADLNTGEMIIDREWNPYFYISKIYNFQELKKEALKVLDGETLTKEEKRKYFLEE